jgi:hypothetical protein
MAQRWWEVFRDDKVTYTKLIDAEVATKPTFFRNIHPLLDTFVAVKEEVGRSVYYRLTGEPPK